MQSSQTVRLSLYKKHPIIAVFLASITFVAIAVAFLQFHFRLVDLPTVVVSGDRMTSIHPLDTVLSQHLSYLGQSSVFRDLLVESHEKTVKSFSMQKCKTTQSDFNAFAQWLQFRDNIDVFSHFATPVDTTYQSRFFEHSILGRLDAPVTGVNLYQAYAYCAAAGGRLPMSFEWEAAASGFEERIYPWGNNFTSTPWQHRNPLLNVAKSCDETPNTVTSPATANMGAASAEWSITRDTPTQLEGVLRGGTALNRPFALHALNFIAKPVAATFSSQFVTFRCVFDSIDSDTIITPWGKKVELVSIAGGQYVLGTPKAAKLPYLVREKGLGFQDLRPLIAQFSQQRTLVHPAIEVGKYEVTVKQYASFLRDPFAQLNVYANSAQPQGHSYTPLYWSQQKHYPMHPVVGVSFWDAYAFASWAGARLPTLDEWHWLFGGGVTQLYPWGNEYQTDLAIVRDTKVRYTPESVEQSLDRSPVGIFAMAGNVSEWTSSSYFADGQQTMVIKGGNYILEGKEAARIDYIARAPAHHRSAAVGFRVIFDR